MRIGVVLVYWPDGTPLPHDECPMAIASCSRKAAVQHVCRKRCRRDESLDGKKSLGQDEIARWPHSCGIKLGKLGA